MKALTFHGIRNIKYESIADPVLQSHTDAIVKVKLCAICGSDLHVYNGSEKGCDHSTAMGHEFVGEVVEVGDEVTTLRSGQAFRVSSSGGDKTNLDFTVVSPNTFAYRWPPIRCFQYLQPYRWSTPSCWEMLYLQDISARTRQI